MSNVIPEYSFLMQFQHGNPVTKKALKHWGYSQDEIDHNIQEEYIAKDPNFNGERYFLTEKGKKYRDGSLE